MKRAFIAYTSFHLLNVLEFVLSNDIKDADLFSLCMFRDHEGVMDRIIQAHVFDNVYVCDASTLQKNEKMWTFIGMLSPSLLVRHLFGIGDIRSKDYLEIYFSVPTRFIDIFMSMYKDARVLAYDDGLGSYLGDVFSNELGRKYKAVMSLFGIKKRYPECVYLNNPDFSIAEYNCTVKPLTGGALSDEHKSLIYGIFDVKYDGEYDRYKCIYLNQPHSDSVVAAYTEDEKNILDVLDKEKTLVRLHPREKNKEFYSAFEIDKGSMWELLCMDHIGDDHVLVSRFSTALFTPKMICSKEPTVIFTYDLARDSGVNDRMKDMIEVLRKSYSDPGKIIIPGSVDEFRQALIRGCHG